MRRPSLPGDDCSIYLFSRLARTKKKFWLSARGGPSFLSTEAAFPPRSHARGDPRRVGGGRSLEQALPLQPWAWPWESVGRGLAASSARRSTFASPLKQPFRLVLTLAATHGASSLALAVFPFSREREIFSNTKQFVCQCRAREIPWSTWSAVGNRTPRTGELRSAPTSTRNSFKTYRSRPQHQTQVHTLRRLILALRAAWGTAVRMEPKAHLGQSYNKQPDVYADSIGKDGTHYCGDVKVVCPLSSSGTIKLLA